MTMVEEQIEESMPLAQHQFTSVEAAIEAAPQLIDGIVTIQRLGKRLVVIAESGVYLLQGASATRYFAPMKTVR